MQITTTKCRQFRHLEFLLEADESRVPASYLEEIASGLEKMVSSGSVFKPDETFQVGWMLTLVRACGDSMLTIVEPDMQSFPIAWVRGITNSLHQLALQKAMLESLGLIDEMDSPNIRDSVIVCSRYAESDFCMTRWEPDERSSSGWFIGCVDERHNHAKANDLNCVSVYEAFLNQRCISAFASFPSGTSIVMDAKIGLEITKDDKKIPVEPGSFIDRWLKTQKRSKG